MTHYFSKLARMTGLSAAGAPSAAPGFALDAAPRGAEPLHGVEVLTAGPQAAEGAPGETGRDAWPQAHRPADSGPAQAGNKVYSTAAHPLDSEPDAGPNGATPTRSAQRVFSVPQAVEFSAGPGQETVLTEQSLPPTRTGAISTSQEVPLPPTADRKSVLDTVPPPDLNPIQEEHRFSASPPPLAAPVAQDLTAEADRALELAVKADRTAKELPEAPAVPLSPQTPSFEARQNSPDPHKDLWREIHAWISAQPDSLPGAPVEAPPAPRHAEEPKRQQEPVQDFSLSIGNISIIVEEPPKPTAAPLPPPAPSGPARADGFFRLDRHYL